MRYLSDDDLMQTRPAEAARMHSPIPTQVVHGFAPLGAARSNLRYGYVAKGVSR